MQSRPDSPSTPHPMVTHRIGWSRVSTRDQNLDLQRDALQKAGCFNIYKTRSAAPSRNAPASTRRWSGVEGPCQAARMPVHFWPGQRGNRWARWPLSFRMWMLPIGPARETAR